MSILESMMDHKIKTTLILAGLTTAAYAVWRITGNDVERVETRGPTEIIYNRNLEQRLWPTNGDKILSIQDSSGKRVLLAEETIRIGNDKPINESHLVVEIAGKRYIIEKIDGTKGDSRYVLSPYSKITIDFQP